MSEQPNPLAQQLAEQLRDVQLPESVSWWPLAIGWWLGLFLGVLTITILSIFLFRRWRSNRYRKSAQQELLDAYRLWQQDDNSNTYIISANSILKRAMLRLGHRRMVSQSGLTWVKTLNQMIALPLSDTAQTALAYEGYKAEPSADVEAIHCELTRWIKRHQNEPLNSEQLESKSHEVEPYA